MEERILVVIKQLENAMQQAVSQATQEMSRMRVGRAHAAMVEHIKVMAYKVLCPIQQVASVVCPNAESIHIKPWQKELISEIEKAILADNIGLTPQNDGEKIVLMVPPLSEERRMETVKKVRKAGENSKIRLRTLRQEGKDKIKRLEKERVSEDEIAQGALRVQRLVEQYVADIDALVARKEKELLTV